MLCVWRWEISFLLEWNSDWSCTKWPVHSKLRLEASLAFSMDYTIFSGEINIPHLVQNLMYFCCVYQANISASRPGCTSCPHPFRGNLPWLRISTRTLSVFIHYVHLRPFCTGMGPTAILRGFVRCPSITQHKNKARLSILIRNQKPRSWASISQQLYSGCFLPWWSWAIGCWQRTEFFYLFWGQNAVISQHTQHLDLVFWLSA